MHFEDSCTGFSYLFHSFIIQFSKLLNSLLFCNFYSLQFCIHIRILVMAW